MGNGYLLSLLWPGWGHWRAGRRVRAVWTAGMCLLLWAILAAGMLCGLPVLTMNAAFTLPALYLFAIADVRHAGGDDAGRNPRIAALLNYTTKGFGYFYLGKRLRWMAALAALLLVQALLVRGVVAEPWGMALALGLQLGIAADGYRLAQAGGEPAAARPVWRVWAAAGLAWLVVAGGAAAWSMLFVPQGRSESVTPEASGLVFTDRTDGFSMTAPSGLRLFLGKSGPAALHLANTQRPYCAATVFTRSSLLPVEQYLTALEQGYAAQRAAKGLREEDATLGGKPARRLFAGLNPPRHLGDATLLEYWVVKRGWRETVLLEENPQNCYVQMGELERSFQWK
jgi:hypothetical protein